MGDSKEGTESGRDPTGGVIMDLMTMATIEDLKNEIKECKSVLVKILQKIDHLDNYEEIDDD